MKYLRKFESVSDMETAAQSSEIDFLGLAYDNGEPVLRIPTPVPPVPFYIEDISGSSNTVKITKYDRYSPTLTIEKSTDGTTWESIGQTTVVGIQATIPANGKLYLRCSTNQWGSGNYYNIINTTGNCNVGGNIMSLLYGSNFTGNETTFPENTDKNFYNLFRENSHIINAGDLLLPATTLTNWCYASMFYGCYSLTTAPALPATTLANYCYSSMFNTCIALTTTPALPATTLANYCYSSMFRSCSGLTTAPELPATTLTNNCYSSMFNGCTGLTTAPELPATTLTASCYSNMFESCSNLNYIKCLATDISASNCTNGWVNYVVTTGTFVKDPNMSDWSTGYNGIPEGWTVQDATE